MAFKDGVGMTEELKVEMIDLVPKLQGEIKTLVEVAVAHFEESVQGQEGTTYGEFWTTWLNSVRKHL